MEGWEAGVPLQTGLMSACLSRRVLREVGTKEFAAVKIYRSLFVLIVAVFAATPTSFGQFAGGFGGGFDEPKKGAETEPTAIQYWKIGLSVTAVQADCGGIFATVPVPTDWPDQSVRHIESLNDISSHVGKWGFRTLDNGVKQLLVAIPQLATGEEAHIYLTYEVAKRTIRPPEDVDSLRIPRRKPRGFHVYLGKSPKIETTDSRIKRVAREVVKGKSGAWERVEAIYDWVRDNVEYKDGPFKGALAALQDGTGDCEELTSLFIALCRANRIPARTVWIQGHCYPEFYLEDDKGQGNWYPCQAAGTRNFGGMFDKRLILQKGDKFEVPEKKKEQRYVAEFLSAKSVKGTGGPQVKFVRELTVVDQPVAQAP